MVRSLAAIVALLGLLLVAGSTALLVWMHLLSTVGLAPTVWLYSAAIALVLAGSAGIAIGLWMMLKKSI